MIEEDDNWLAHYGIKRRSGRYPWGSGDNPGQRGSQDFYMYVNDLRKQGLSDVEIARGLGISTTQLRAARSVAKTKKRQADAAEAFRLREKGMSTTAIGERMGINESSVRSLLDPSRQQRTNILDTTIGVLREEVAGKKYLDVGAGTEQYLGISPDKLRTAVAALKDEGYNLYYYKVKQLGTGKETTLKVLTPPDVPYKEMAQNADKIGSVAQWSDDGGRTFFGIKPPLSVDSSRVQVKYGDEGGADADGVVYIRPGVDDISIGKSRYAQVRIAVDGSHYIKGMGLYRDDLPEGVDLVFNTNKKNTGNKLDALKPLKDDPDNPFGSVIRRQLLDKNENVISAANIVNEEGAWGEWSRSLSSQMLSKQSPKLAKEQLDLAYSLKKAEFDEINSLTNPAVRKRLLEAFADDADSSAVHLKAAALPRQSTKVILPVNELKDTEIYAPSYRDGEQVVLIRYPHGGIFEIPELRVNNRNPAAKKALGQAIDAVGINSKVAQRLSGADFDGDTVLVIPNNSRKVKNMAPLEQLKNFDPQTAYPGYAGMKKMSSNGTQTQMGDVSNLITDMTVKGAPVSDIARAVKHSMVVIDAAKHGLNYKQSAIDNGISELKQKYQQTDSRKKGAATIISRASSPVRVPDRKPRPASQGGPIDPATGRKVFIETGETYVNKSGKVVRKLSPFESSRMAETDDARTLSSGTRMEEIYAGYANRMKDLANASRKAAYETKPTPKSSTARNTYKREVDQLTSKLALAQRNKPLERQAQLLANAVVKEKARANPEMEAPELKKIKGQALEEARRRTGAKKQQIVLEPREWEAIQAGAVSNNVLKNILDNADLDVVKQLATPREPRVMTSPVLLRAKAMLARGYTQAEIADQLGVPTSTLNTALAKE